MAAAAPPLPDEAFEEEGNLRTEANARWAALPMATKVEMSRRTMAVIRTIMTHGVLSPILYSALAPHYTAWRNNVFANPPVIGPMWDAADRFCLGKWVMLAHDDGHTEEIEAIFGPHGFSTYTSKKTVAGNTVQSTFTMKSFSGARFIPLVGPPDTGKSRAIKVFTGSR